MTKKMAVLAILAMFGLMAGTGKTQAGERFSIHIGVHPWVSPFSYYSSRDDYRYGFGSGYNYYRPRTEVVVRNTSNEPITISIVDQSGRKRKEKKILPVAAYATVRFVANSPNNSRVYRFIARDRKGQVLAEKEVYLYGRQWNWDELWIDKK